MNERLRPAIRTRWVIRGLAVALLLGATRAEAHTMMSTAGPFVAGVKHFFLSLDDVLAAFAMGLLAGLRKERPGDATVLALPAAWLALGVAGLLLGSAAYIGERASAVSLIVLGVLAATDCRLPGRALVLLAIAAGGLHGYANGSAVQEVGTLAGFWQLTGITVSAFFIVLYPTALLDLNSKRPWVRIVARVLGSWVAAIGLLLLGWSLRAGGKPLP